MAPEVKSAAQFLFWASASYVIYIVALYPLLLNAWARRFARPWKRQPYFPSVAMVMATHNGESFLKEKLDSIFALDYPQNRLQVIVVDDGSTDNTSYILSRCSWPSFAVIRIEKAGKSAALNRGIAAAQGEILVFTDVRQKLAVDSLRLLMENFADPTVGCASAELQIAQGESTAEANIGAYWKYERWIRLNLSQLDSIFGASGSYYAVRCELAVMLPANTLLDDMYLPLAGFFRGYRLVVDQRARMYDYATALATEFGRKVRTLAGNYQVLRAYPELLSFKNRLWIHFVSYKFGRLLLPFALLVAAGSGLAAGGQMTRLSFSAELLFCALVLLDPFLSERSILKRLTAPAKTFAVMMLATLCAASIWFVPPERFWKPTRIVRRDGAVL